MSGEGEWLGELYLRTTLPFLSGEITAREVRCLAALFRRHGAAGSTGAQAQTQDQARGPILDVGCGHGRHASALARELLQPVIGLELDPLSLRMRLPGFPAIRGDFRALPIRPGSLAGAYAWYSTLFVLGSDDAHSKVLAELGRALRPGGLLILHTVPFERLAARPSARFETDLPDGAGHLVEESAFDPAAGVDRLRRRLEMPGGRVLSGAYTIRYYRLPELEELLEGAGMRVVVAWGGLQGEPPAPGATDLIVGAIRDDA